VAGTVVKFKAAARVPPGITPDMVLADLHAVRDRYGRMAVDDAVKAVLAEPERYPALRAFGPPDAETAFRDAVREGIEYAVRVLVVVRLPDEGPETRLLHITHDPGDGAAVWADVPTIAASEPMQRELVRNLQRDARAFTRKLESTLAELAAVLGA
jgi:hypothetical protein